MGIIFCRDFFIPYETGRVERPIYFTLQWYCEFLLGYIMLYISSFDNKCVNSSPQVYFQWVFVNTVLLIKRASSICEKYV